MNALHHSILTSLLGASALLSPLSAQADFRYADFASVPLLTLNGDAARTGNALRLSNAADFTSGSVFTTSAVSMGPLNSFSTAFSFRIGASGGIADADGTGADGLVFVVQAQAQTVGGDGRSLGYGGIDNSIGIEFDTFDNGPAFGDPDGNHVGIDIDGDIVSLQTAAEPVRFNNGQVWNAWVDYEGAAQRLQVRWSAGAERPFAAQLERTIDLVGVLGQNTAFIGFTSATGSAWGDHDVLAWEYRDRFAPIATVPEPAGMWSLALGLLWLMASRLWRKAVSRRAAGHLGDSCTKVAARPHRLP